MVSGNILGQGGFKMVITATEFKANIGKYLSLTKEGEVEITITKNGKSIAKLTSIKRK